MPFRDLSPAACVAYLVVSVGALAGVTGWLAGRFGAPRRWPLAWQLTMVAAPLVLTLVWWWIDQQVEGRLLLALDAEHGLAVGDLLILPALLLALVVGVDGAIGRRSRA